MGSDCKSELLGIQSLLGEVKPVKHRSTCQAQIALPACSQFSASVRTLRGYSTSKENITWNNKLDRQLSVYLSVRLPPVYFYIYISLFSLSISLQFIAHLPCVHVSILHIYNIYIIVYTLMYILYILKIYLKFRILESYSQFSYWHFCLIQSKSYHKPVSRSFQKENNLALQAWQHNHLSLCVSCKISYLFYLLCGVLSCKHYKEKICFKCGSQRSKHWTDTRIHSCIKLNYPVHDSLQIALKRKIYLTSQTCDCAAGSQSGWQRTCQYTESNSCSFSHLGLEFKILCYSSNNFSEVCIVVSGRFCTSLLDYSHLYEEYKNRKSVVNTPVLYLDLLLSITKKTKKKWVTT